MSESDVVKLVVLGLVGCAVLLFALCCFAGAVERHGFDQEEGKEAKDVQES